MSHVERLESRQLLSVAPLVTAHVKPTIPNIVGTYTGSATQLKPTAQPAQSGFVLTITGETSSGVLSGTFLNPGKGGTGTFVGRINVKGKFSAKVPDAILTGSYNASTLTISGAFHVHKTGKASSGTFSFSE